jgi:5'-methylthioadenosine phosphorylase
MAVRGRETISVIGIFGGSGFYSFVEDATATAVPGRYGPPSAVPLVGSIDGTPVVFIPRHGVSHEYAPHRVPYRANVDAMRSLGVDRIVASTAVGSLTPHYAPGHFAVPDQLVDRTWGRESTLHDGPGVGHLSFADPFHPAVRQVALTAMRGTGAVVHDGGTVVVIQGPRFSTRAESRSYADAGWHMINMTQMPEAALCAEAGIAYANVSVITDYDVGIDGGDAVTHEEVLRRFAESSDVLGAGFRALVPLLEHADLGETP